MCSSDLQATVDQMIADGLVAPEVAAEVEKVSAEIDRVQPQLAEIARAVADAEYSGGDNLTTLIEGLQAGNEASAPFNPYAGYIQLGLGGAAAIAAWLARQKAREAGAYKAKYTAHKQGIESARLAINNPEFNAIAYDKIGEARARLQVN